MENTEYDEKELQFMDDVSEYSGDSILIGVEDQTEFNDYKEKVEEAEVDMDLYNKMWGKVKRLDDYHVEQEGRTAIKMAIRNLTGRMFISKDYHFK